MCVHVYVHASMSVILRSSHISSGPQKHARHVEYNPSNTGSSSSSSSSSSTGVTQQQQRGKTAACLKPAPRHKSTDASVPAFLLETPRYSKSTISRRGTLYLVHMNLVHSVILAFIPFRNANMVSTYIQVQCSQNAGRWNYSCAAALHQLSVASIIIRKLNADFSIAHPMYHAIKLGD